LIELSKDKDVYIAFKGEHYEQALFNEIGLVKYLNLENLNCPKFQNMNSRTITQARKYLPPENFLCNRHEPLKSMNTSLYHCPQMKVPYFGAWLWKEALNG